LYAILKRERRRIPHSLWGDRSGIELVVCLPTATLITIRQMKQGITLSRDRGLIRMPKGPLRERDETNKTLGRIVQGPNELYQFYEF
jgi:hypothetical protein